jgi:hypothetical protein
MQSYAQSGASGREGTDMSDIDTARTLLQPYIDKPPRVGNPVNRPSNEWQETGIERSRRLEARISLDVPTEMGLTGLAATRTAGQGEYWVRGGEIVAANLDSPLTCALFAHLVVYALRQAPTFGSRIEVVEIRRGKADNHYVVVVGRSGGDVNGDLARWGDGAFVIDLWGAAQGLGPAISSPPAIIVAGMADPPTYPRRVVATIEPW